MPSRKTNGAVAAPAPKLIAPNIGLSDSARKAVAKLLNVHLANTFVLYTKTRNYHWNIVGMEFQPLHGFFEEQYDALAESMDEIAERVRQVGGIAAGTLEEFSVLTTLEEDPGHVPTAREMLANLLADHESIIRGLRADVDATAEEYKDVGTSDFLTGLMESHEKMAWMLRAFLEG